MALDLHNIDRHKFVAMGFTKEIKLLSQCSQIKDIRIESQGVITTILLVIFDDVTDRSEMEVQGAGYLSHGVLMFAT